MNRDFPLGPYADKNVGEQCTGTSKVFERSHSPANHPRFHMASARFRMSLRPVWVRYPALANNL